MGLLSMFNLISRFLPIILAGSIGFTASLHADAYIFDIGGVLVDTHKIKTFKMLGITNFFKYFIIIRRSPERLKDKFFETLNNVARVNKINTHPGRTVSRDNTGKPLPRLMILWLKGKMSAEQIRTMSLEAIEKHPEWFDHPVEQKIICNIISLTFTPKKYIATRMVYQKMVDFVKQCKHHGHQVYILSNWDPESFALLQQTYPEIFNLFDGIMISGDVGNIKPNKKIYKKLLAKYHLNPRTSQIWFIDDQIENITAARKFKICGIWCKKQKSLFGFGANPDLNYVTQQIANAQKAKDFVTAQYVA